MGRPAQGKKYITAKDLRPGRRPRATAPCAQLVCSLLVSNELLLFKLYAREHIFVNSFSLLIIISVDEIKSLSRRKFFDPL